MTSSKLGTSKGGTRLNIHVTGSGIDDVGPHYLRVNDWDPVRATHQNVVSNGAIEDEFVMPPLSYTTRSVVRLSYSLDGVRYVKAGEFVYYGKLLYIVSYVQLILDVSENGYTI